MRSPIDLTFVLLAPGVAFGLFAVAGAILAAHAWSAAIGVLGVVVAGRSGVALAKWFGVTDQPR